MLNISPLFLGNGMFLFLFSKTPEFYTEFFRTMFVSAHLPSRGPNGPVVGRRECSLFSITSPQVIIALYV